VSVPAADCTLSRGTVDRYVSMFEGRGQPVAVANDTVFYNYNRMVEPLAPAGHDAALTGHQARELLDDLGGVLVRWGGGFRDHDTGWYHVICDDYPALDDNPSRRGRRDIRKGLRACRVEQVDAEYIARHGYQVYASAFSRYAGRQSADDERVFVRRMRSAAPYPDLVHYWGVFSGAQLVGYSANYVFEDIEVALSELKLDPAHLGQYSSYALMHAMTEHYARSGVAWVNAGTRSLAHDTAFQPYLISKFQFRKAFVRLRVAFRPAYALGLRVTRPLRRVLGRADPRLDALYELHRLSRLDPAVPQAGSIDGD
jgi:hypothetical protein